MTIPFAPNYEALPNGVIFSKKRQIYLRPSTVTGGYKSVVLRVDGKSRCYRVHRLVAIVHLPNPTQKTIVHHRDGNPANNTVENLEWCAPVRNNLYRNKANGYKNHQEKIRDLIASGVLPEVAKYAMQK